MGMVGPCPCQVNRAPRAQTRTASPAPPASRCAAIVGAMRKKRRRLCRADWVRAALEAIASGGLAAVTIPVLSRRLGATKGSFYWHFESFDELLATALESELVVETRRKIGELEAIPDPRERLRAAMTPQANETLGSVDVALAAAAADPRVAPWLAAHNRLWLAFSRRAFRDMELAQDEVEHRALLAYTTYLGLVSLRLTDAKAVPGPAGFSRYLGFLRDIVIPPRWQTEP